MQLTSDQQKKVQEILDKYKSDVDRVVNDFQKQVRVKLEEIDKLKIEEIKKMLLDGNG